MFDIKYLILIGAIVCLLILYYFYDEISSVKKLFVPTYQKTMALEAKIFELEKKTQDFLPKKIIHTKNDSPALSITYNSDLVKNGNLSVKYADLSESEAQHLLKKIHQESQNKKSQINSPTKNKPEQNNQTGTNIAAKPNNITNLETNQIQKIKNIPSGELSDFQLDSQSSKQKIKPDEDFFDGSDTINLKFTDILKKKPMEKNDESKNLKQKNNTFEQLLDSLTADIINENKNNDFEEFNENELNTDIIKNISESIQYADMPSDNELSDIPVIKPTKNTKKPTKKTGNNLPKKNAK